MALSNPERIVNVQELDYFRRKADAKYATQSTVGTLQEQVDGLSQGAQITTLFGMWVDPTDMHLKGTGVTNGEFSLVNGHLLFTTSD